MSVEMQQGKATTICNTLLFKLCVIIIIVCLLYQICHIKSIFSPHLINNRKSNITLSKPSYYQDGMVFQGFPDSHNIWGFTNNPNEPIFVHEVCPYSRQSAQILNISRRVQSTSTGTDYLWEILMPGIKDSANQDCVLTVTQSEASFDVHFVFGEVWFCSGQSNMWWDLNKIAAFEKINLKLIATRYKNIRFFNTHLATSDVIHDDLVRVPDKPIIGNRISDFQNWVSLGSYNLDYQLALEEESDSTNLRLDTLCVSGSYNRSMVTVANQQYSENNYAHNRDSYTCSLLATIRDWRSTWRNDPSEFVFGSVQLANCEVLPGQKGSCNRGVNYAPVRWMQTAEAGYLPNQRLDNAFMATAYDTYDEGSIHPRYKSVIAKRLAYAATAKIYGNSTTFPVPGPFPRRVQVLNSTRIQVSYGASSADLIFKSAKGFYACCLSSITACDSSFEASLWLKIDPTRVTFRGNGAEIRTHELCPNGSLQGVAYAWETNPFKQYLGASVYEKVSEDLSLPGLPWKCAIQESECTV